MTENATSHKTTLAASHAPVAPGGVAPAAALAENPEKNYVKTLVFATLFGYFGVDRFYLNKVGTGVAKLLTFGGFGIWVLVDFIITLIGAAREKDKPDLELQDTQKYKPFFVKVTLICVAIYVGLFVLEIILFAFLAWGVRSGLDHVQTQTQRNQFECRDTVRNVDLPAEACQGQSQSDLLNDSTPVLRVN